MDERRNLIDCARLSEASESLRDLWKHSASVNACFQEGGFTYGIYLKAVNLTNESKFFKRSSYSLFWGFQVKQIRLYMMMLHLLINLEITPN